MLQAVQLIVVLEKQILHSDFHCNQPIIGRDNLENFANHLVVEPFYQF